MVEGGRFSPPAFRQVMRVVNPLVALVLRSPVHGLFGGSLLLLTLRGRRTGREHTFPVLYAAAGDVLYVMPGRPHLKRGWRNLVGGAPVRVRMRCRDLNGRADLLAGDANPNEVGRALAIYFTRFPSAAWMRRVRRLPDDTFDPHDLGAVTARTGVARSRV